MRAARVLAGPTLAALAALAGACGTDDYLVGTNADASAGPALFAVAYLDREEVREDPVTFRINPAIGRIISLGDDGAALDLSRLRVASVDDDSPRVDVSFAIDGPTYLLPGGHAGGRLVAGDTWIDPLVSEPLHRADGPSLAYRLDYLDPPPHTFAATVHATVVLALDEHEATLPFVIEIRATGELGGGPTGARRVRSTARR